MSWILRQLFKRVFQRLEFWIIWIVLGLLIDEYIKEGYWFKLSDIFIPFSHEFIIAILLVFLFCYRIMKA